jgi:ATP-dependent helicase/nuclease subunit B
MAVRTIQSWSNGILAAEAEAFAARFTESLLIRPRRLAGEGLTHGSLGVHAVSLPQAAMEIAAPRLARRGLAPATPLGLEALAARVVHRALEDNALVYFTPVARLPGFSRALARTLLDLRLARVPPGGLPGAGEPARDLAALLESYEAELAERSLADFAAVLALAAEAAREDRHRWIGLPLALLHVELPSRLHREFAEQLAARAPEVLWATHPEPGEPSGGGPAADSLEHLRNNLFLPAPALFPAPDGCFEYFSAPGEGLEAVEIARRILKLAREGVRFDEIAILLRNPERYQPVIEDALARAAIPAYFSRGTRRPDVAGRAFLALIHCAAERLSAARFAEYLSLNQVPEQAAPAAWVAPEEEMLGPPAPAEEAEPPAGPARPTPRRWEQFLVEAAVVGGLDRWERRLNGLEAEWRLQNLENDPRIEQLRNLRNFALPLIGALSGLPRTARWSEWLERLTDLARRALRSPEGVLAALAELAPMGEVGPAGLEEVTEVLSERLRFLRREPPARRWGCVFVGSVEEARGREFGVVFLPGLAEGLFPQRPAEDPLLLDEFRRIIDETLPLRSHRSAEERLRLRLAVGAARTRLIASYPRMDVAEARPRVPSFYALELPRAIEGALPELREFENCARGAAPARLNWPAPQTSAEAIDDAEYDLVQIAAARNRPGAAAYLVQVNAHLARSLRARWYRWKPKWRPADGAITSEPEALAVLEGHRLTAREWSPSALENFAVCPYKFALHGIYRLRPREEAAPLEQLDPLTRGALFHAVQFRLFHDLRERALLPVTPDNVAQALARAETALEHVASEFAEQLAPAIERVWRSEIDDLRTDLRGWLHFTAVNETEWIPQEFEHEFHETLAEGVRLRGKIDLVERHHARGTLRVVDHKTGRRPDTVPQWVGGGKHLQPVLYALAAEQTSGRTVEAGRLMYATQRGQYVPHEIKLDARARQFMARLLANIDAMIAGGFLPPVPDRGACEICDYRAVCGPYEERRLAKKDRRDERLEPLDEIRGMA